MPQFIIPIVLAIAFSVVAYLIAPKPGSINAQVTPEFRTTSNSSGTPWPDFIGLGYMPGNLIWDGAYYNEVLTIDANQAIYQRSWAIGLCIGEVDEIMEIRWGESCIYWLGSIKRSDAVNGMVEAVTPKGKFRVYFGTDDQNPDPYWESKLGGEPLTPMRGLCYIVFEKNRIEQSSLLPDVLVRLSRQPAPAFFDTDFGASNAMPALWDRLTHPLKAALPVSLFDEDSFDTNQQLASDVGGGALFIYEPRQQTVSDIIQKILYHVDGVLIIRGGKLTVKLQERDTVLGSTPVFQSRDVKRIKRIPQGWSELSNQFEVLYPNSTTLNNTDTLPVPDANLDPTDIRKETIVLPYIPSGAVANMIGNRKRQHLAAAHDSIEVDFMRSGFRLEWGDTFRLALPDEDISTDMPWRIMDYKEAAIGSELITVSAILDHFRASTISANPEVPDGPPGGSGGHSDVPPIDTLDAYELEWGFNNSDEKLCTLCCLRPVPSTGSFELWGVGPSESYQLIRSQARFCAGGVLLENYPAATLEVDDVIGIRLRSLSDDLSAFSSVSREQMYGRAVLGRFEDGEIVSIQQIIPLGNNDFLLVGIVRGLEDTDKVAHGSGGRFYIPRVYDPANILASWTQGETVSLKGLPIGGPVVSSIDSALPAPFVMQNRARRPYPVSNLLVDGAGALQSPIYTAATPFRISWVPRTRGVGIGYSNPLGPFDPTIAVEGNFIVRIYAADDTTLLRTFTVAAGTTFADGYGVNRHFKDYDPATDGNPASIFVHVNSNLGGWESLASRSVEVIKV